MDGTPKDVDAVIPFLFNIADESASSFRHYNLRGPALPHMRMGDPNAQPGFAMNEAAVRPLPSNFSGNEDGGLPSLHDSGIGSEEDGEDGKV